MKKTYISRLQIAYPATTTSHPLPSTTHPPPTQHAPQTLPLTNPQPTNPSPAPPLPPVQPPTPSYLPQHLRPPTRNQLNSPSQHLTPPPPPTYRHPAASRVTAPQPGSPPPRTRRVGSPPVRCCDTFLTVASASRGHFTSAGYEKRGCEGLQAGTRDGMLSYSSIHTCTALYLPTALRCAVHSHVHH